MRIGVVIPAFRPGNAIFEVLSGIGSLVSNIYVIDDSCPQNTGQRVLEKVTDQRVKVFCLTLNAGVGGATKRGFIEALSDENDIIVKIDADGQIDPALISDLVKPITLGEADYVKGNRFFSRDTLQGMPRTRLVGNFFLSLLSKASTGYWNISDPTNGFFAVHADVLRCMDWHKTADRFFFESDLLFRLRLIDAKVTELPMRARYGQEVSNLNPLREIPVFFGRHLLNLAKRIGYLYYLRGFSKASVFGPVGLVLLFFSVIFGGILWQRAAETAIATPVGSVMLVLIAAVIGNQLVLDALSEDMSLTPREALTSGGRSKLDSLMSLRKQNPAST